MAKKCKKKEVAVSYNTYTVIVEAEVSLLIDSGRKLGIISGYRPNHNFGDENNLLMRFGQIDFSSDEFIQLGETKVVTISFGLINTAIKNNLLIPDFTWRIQEASRLVGYGKIIKALSCELDSEQQSVIKITPYK